MSLRYVLALLYQIYHSSPRQQMVRYMVILYREDLYELQRLELGRTSASASHAASGSSGSPLVGALSRRKSTTRREWDQATAASEEKEQVATDLLAILQKIPIQVIGECRLT